MLIFPEITIQYTFYGYVTHEQTRCMYTVMAVLMAVKMFITHLTAKPFNTPNFDAYGDQMPGDVTSCKLIPKYFVKTSIKCVVTAVAALRWRALLAIMNYFCVNGFYCNISRSRYHVQQKQLETAKYAHRSPVKTVTRWSMMRQNSLVASKLMSQLLCTPKWNRYKDHA